MLKFLRYILAATALVWAQQVSPTINPSPSREFGQPALLSSLNSIAPNLVEGRELDAPIAVAFDTSATPPILYIVDNANNRVLAYKNPPNSGKTDADFFAAGTKLRDDLQKQIPSFESLFKPAK